MTTLDSVLLIIITGLLSILFLVGIVVLATIIKLLNEVRVVVAKANEVVDSVEEAADIFKNTSGRLAAFKLIRNIIKHAQKSRR